MLSRTKVPKKPAGQPKRGVLAEKSPSLETHVCFSNLSCRQAAVTDYLVSGLPRRPRPDAALWCFARGRTHSKQADEEAIMYNNAIMYHLMMNRQMRKLHGHLPRQARSGTGTPDVLPRTTKRRKKLLGRQQRTGQISSSAASSSSAAAAAAV
jgi:hypothetical protein